MKFQKLARKDELAVTLLLVLSYVLNLIQYRGGYSVRIGLATLVIAFEIN